MASRSRAGSRPATARTTVTSYEGAASWVLAILPGRGTGRDVGVVALDKDSGQVVVTQVRDHSVLSNDRARLMDLVVAQFTDSTTWVKTLHLCRNKPPDVILLPQSALSTPRHALSAESEATEAAGSSSPEAAMLVKGLQSEFRDVPLIAVARKYWNEQASPSSGRMRPRLTPFVLDRTGWSAQLLAQVLLSRPLIRSSRRLRVPHTAHRARRRPPRRAHGLQAQVLRPVCHLRAVQVPRDRPLALLRSQDAQDPLLCP